MYNLGGLTNKKSFLNKVFPHVISQLESRYRDIKEYQSEINLFDISEESYLTDTKAPGFHIANEDDHVKIAKYYHQRINEILNNAGNK